MTLILNKSKSSRTNGELEMVKKDLLTNPWAGKAAFDGDTDNALSETKRQIEFWLRYAEDVADTQSLSAWYRSDAAFTAKVLSRLLAVIDAPGPVTVPKNIGAVVESGWGGTHLVRAGFGWVPAWQSHASHAEFKDGYKVAKVSIWSDESIQKKLDSGGWKIISEGVER